MEYRWLFYFQQKSKPHFSTEYSKEIQNTKKDISYTDNIWLNE